MLKSSLETYGDLSGFVYNRKSKQIVGGHRRKDVLPANSKIVIEKTYSQLTKTGTRAEGFIIANGERFSYREVEWGRNKEKAANIAANKGAGDWDFDQLGEWMRELEESGIDLDLTMFDEKEREQFFLTDKAKGEDEVPGVQKKTSIKPGDLFQLGEHRLLCGDSTVASEVTRLMNGEKADMVFTDPPYNHAEKDDLVASPVSEAIQRLKNSEWDRGFDCAEMLARIDEAVALDCSIYICTSWHLAGQIWEFYSTRSTHSSYCVWSKPNPMPSLMKRHWTWASEIICYATRGKHVFNFPAEGHARNVWEIQKNQKNDLHPTMKPVELVEKAIVHSSNKGQMVLDLFLGSGSTLIACEKTNRKCYGMEIDPLYCQVIIDRWEKFTGKKASLLTKKKTLNEKTSKSKKF